MTVTKEQLERLRKAKDPLAGTGLELEPIFTPVRIDDLTALIAAYEAMEARPIAEHDKDGSWVLAHWQHEWRWARWLDNSKSDIPWTGWRVPSMEPHPRGAKSPTHFIPLSALPKPEGE